MLNALRQSEENHTSLTTARRTGPGSAQRLTAIRGKSRVSVGGKALWDKVLNALRQSEENHTVADPSIPCGRRAQRLTAIRGKSRVSVGGKALWDKVLNALRQSEENHKVNSRARSKSLLLCSTPYGNQRKITVGSPFCVLHWL